METLTIELKDPNAKKLLENLADLNLISILKTSSWTERWQKLSTSLPNVSEIADNDILEEIQIYRNEKNSASQ